MAGRDIANTQPNYATDIAHLLPAELTAFYIGAKGIIPTLPNAVGSPDPLSTPMFFVHVGFASTLALLFFLVMPAMLGIRGISQRVLYCVTFLIWVIGIDVDRISHILASWDPAKTVLIAIVPVVINLVVAVWSFGVPFIFRKINPGQPVS